MIKHGHYNSYTYRSWIQMRRRCLDKKCHNYPKYGGRGITVCKRWDDFALFLADMGERPKGYTLDRIDCNKGYYKENCRWATALTQNWNRRNIRNITYKNKTLHVTEWAAKLGLKPECLKKRIYVNKWPVEKAFKTPLLRIRKCQ